MSDFREQWEFNRATAELAHERDFARHERLDNYTVESGQNAIKAVGIINGGAAVAFVALMGNIVDSDVLKQIDRELIARCFLIFSGGVVLSAMASGLSYVTHYCHTGQNANQILNFEHPYVHETPKSRRWKIAGGVTHSLAFVAALASIGAFVWGALNAKDLLSAALVSAPLHPSTTPATR